VGEAWSRDETAALVYTWDGSILSLLKIRSGCPLYLHVSTWSCRFDAPFPSLLLSLEATVGVEIAVTDC
jgi:hypothetical protein